MKERTFFIVGNQGESNDYQFDFQQGKFLIHLAPNKVFITHFYKDLHRKVV
jgi:hypothetical protein